MSFESWYDSLGEKSFVRILSPRKDRGITFLKLDTNLWQYMPSINREIKIESSLMSDSWMGSDFSNDDLVQESSSEKDYTHKYIKSENEKNCSDVRKNLLRIVYYHVCRSFNYYTYQESLKISA